MCCDSRPHLLWCSSPAHCTLLTLLSSVYTAEAASAATACVCRPPPVATASGTAGKQVGPATAETQQSSSSQTHASCKHISVVAGSASLPALRASSSKGAQRLQPASRVLAAAARLASMHSTVCPTQHQGHGEAHQRCLAKHATKHQQAHLFGCVLLLLLLQTLTVVVVAARRCAAGARAAWREG
jgi:hypothetical protein